MSAICPDARPAVCPTGTPTVRHAGRCWVQNQNQNQTVVTPVCGSSVADQVQSVKAVEGSSSATLGLGAKR